MIQFTVPAQEYFDDVNQEFKTIKEFDLVLEHSLVSISKWESKWKMPFLSSKEKSREQSIDYIRCMTINQNVSALSYNLIPDGIMSKIMEYIHDPMTATTFLEDSKKKTSREVITAELIYYWMIAFNIPMECQRWHLNRLLTLINVCNLKNQPQKKMSKAEIMAKNRELNASRLAAYKTKG